MTYVIAIDPHEPGAGIRNVTIEGHRLSEVLVKLAETSELPYSGAVTISAYPKE